MERGTTGYYRSKVRQLHQCEDIKAGYVPYITKHMLQQLQYPRDTQTNEAMNQALSPTLPKQRTALRPFPLTL